MPGLLIIVLCFHGVPEDVKIYERLGFEIRIALALDLDTPVWLRVI